MWLIWFIQISAAAVLATTGRTLAKHVRRDVAECFASPDVILEEVVECYVKVHLRSSDKRQRVCDRCAASPFCHPRGINQVISPSLLWSFFDCGAPTFQLKKKKKNHSKGHKKMRSVIKKSRPGRAARGKLGNTALYCTHDISFPLFDFFFYFLGGGGEKQALALHVFVLHPTQTRSLTGY